MSTIVSDDTALIRDMKESIAHWPAELKLAFLKGEINLEQAFALADGRDHGSKA